MWVEKRKNGTYKFVERYTDYMTGKVKRVSVNLDKNTAQTRKLAQRTLNEKIDSIMAVANAPKEQTITLGKLVEAYRQEQQKTIKQSTYRRNYHSCNTLLKILGEDTLVNRLNAQYIRQSLFCTGKEPGTLNEFLVRLKALLRWGYHNDLIADISYLDKVEPFKDVPHRQKIQDKFLESNEAKCLLSGMKHEPWHLLTQFLILSGLRIGEAIALNKSDIDFDENLIHVTKTYDSNNRVVTTPKTFTSARDVYMQDALRDLCQRINIYMLRQRVRYGYEKSSIFFQGTDGGHIHYYAYNKYLKETSRKVLGRIITVHSLRHTHASLLMESGVNIDTISRRLGHENSQVTREIYLHVTEKLKAKDNEQIAHAEII